VKKKSSMSRVRLQVGVRLKVRVGVRIMTRIGVKIKVRIRVRAKSSGTYNPNTNVAFISNTNPKTHLLETIPQDRWQSVTLCESPPKESQYQVSP
jgi:hypothetical protein